MSYSPALESIFANAEQQCAGLIETITTAINSKINTVEDGEKLALDLSAEAAKFNQSLLTLDNIKSQIEAGELSKEDGVAQATPIVRDLKANCCALKMSGADLSDSEDITTEEIAILREIISGAKSAAEARVVELRTAGDPTTDTEVDDVPTNGVLESLLNTEPSVEPAEESSKKVISQLRKSTEAKTAATLKKNAKKLYSMGSKEKAITYMEKAKKLYDGLVDKAKKECKFFNAERKVTASSNGNTVEDKYTTKITNDTSGLDLVTYFENLSDSCRAYLMQWQNKAGNSTLAETKAQLKAERKEERKRIREERKAKLASESVDDTEMESYGEAVMEAAIAMEGLNKDASKLKKQYSKEMKEYAKAAKRAYKNANFPVAKQMYLKCADVADQLAADIKALPDGDAKSVRLGNLLYSVKAGFGAVNFSGIKASTTIDDIDRCINQMNKSGSSQLQHNDLNRWLNMIEKWANELSKKFREAAAKASKAGGLDAEPDSKATESYELDQSTQNLVNALENYMDRLETDDLTMALEATSDEGPAPSGLGAKIRALLHRAKKSKAEGNDSDANKAMNEAQAAINELETEAKNADTPKKKKHIARNIAIAGAAIAAVGLGVTAVAANKAGIKGPKDVKAIKEMRKEQIEDGVKKVSGGEELTNMDKAGKKEYIAMAKDMYKINHDANGEPELTSVMGELKNGFRMLGSDIKKMVHRAPAKEAFSMTEADEATGLYGIIGSLIIDPNAATESVTDSASDDDDYEDAALESMFAVWAAEDGIDEDSSDE